MLTFCELVSGLILRMIKFGFDAGRMYIRERHLLDRFFKFVSQLVKNIVNLYMCYIKACFHAGLRPRFALQV